MPAPPPCYTSKGELRVLLEEILDRKLGEVQSTLLSELQQLRDGPLQRAGTDLFLRHAATPLWGGTQTQSFRFSQVEPPEPMTPPDEHSEIRHGERVYVHALKSMGSQYESFYDYAKAFGVLCGGTKSSISATDLIKIRARHVQARLPDPNMKKLNQRFAEAIFAVNRARAEGFRQVESRQSYASKDDANGVPMIDEMREITLDTFTVIMGQSEGRLQLEEEVLETIEGIREILIKEETFRKVAMATNTSTTDLQTSSRLRTLSTMGASSVMGCRPLFHCLLRYLDPFIGFVILLNAVVVLVSTDVARDAAIWDTFELVFTIIFISELVVKVLVHGPKTFCTGRDMCWNIFDIVVVLFATMDIVFKHLKIENFTLLRLLRFARLTKLVRVLKLKAFAELVMLVNGVLVGFRTLVWVVMFLIFLLLVLGVVMTETVGRQDFVRSGHCSSTDMSGEDKAFCDYSEAHLNQYRITLFGNTFRSMFTVFRCLTDGCSSVDGTPLVPQFLHSLGPTFLIIYMLVFVFVTFGLFNLVMAVFVESTINGAKRADIRRKEAQWSEHIKTARKLQKLIVMFHKGMRSSSDLNPGKERHPILNWLADAMRTRQNTSEEEEVRETKVSQAAFYKVCERPEAQKLLEDLDIDVNSRRVIFDVLDANGDGTLGVTELVQGLLRLRGVGDRCEMVASLLAIRAVQRGMRSLEAVVVHQQKSIQKILGSVDGCRGARRSTFSVADLAEARAAMAACSSDCEETTRPSNGSTVEFPI